jgi:hypothetical protein
MEEWAKHDANAGADVEDLMLELEPDTDEELVPVEAVLRMGNG